MQISYDNYYSILAYNLMLTLRDLDSLQLEKAAFTAIRTLSTNNAQYNALFSAYERSVRQHMMCNKHLLNT